MFLHKPALDLAINFVQSNDLFFWLKNDKSNHRRCSIKKLFLKIPQYSPKNNYVGIMFKGLQACNFIKERLQHRCFHVNIVKFLRAPFKNTHSEKHLRTAASKFSFIRTSRWSCYTKFSVFSDSWVRVTLSIFVPMSSA